MATKKVKLVEPKLEEKTDDLEVKEIPKLEEVKAEEPQAPIVVIEEVKPIEPLPIVESVKQEVELSFEERILAFVDSRSGASIRLNDFLKSLFPLPKIAEPPKWLNQAESKKLRVLLGELQTKGLVKLADNRYTLLGRSYYFGAEQVQKHYSIADLEIICQK